MRDEVPRIVTDIPSEKAREVLKKDSCYISESYARGYPLVVTEGDKTS